jgi:4-amino-4-deoxy-L-arabinose transferase-like glycosyltransferase
MWWAIFFPGFYSGDSFLALDMAQTGNLTNSGTASWAVFVRIFSLWGNAFPILSLLCGLLLVYATTQLAFALFQDSTAAVSSLLLSATPLVAGMGITLWHDIPFTAGLILVASFMINTLRYEKRNLKRDFYALLLPGAVLTTFKPNGIATLIVFGLLLLCQRKTRRLYIYLLLPVSLAIALTLSLSYGVLKQDPINEYYGQEWMRADISCFASTPQGTKLIESKIHQIRNVSEWASVEACTFLNNAPLSIEQKIAAQEFVPGAWVTILLNDPLFILNTHLQRHDYLFPNPLAPFPTVPFLHSTIEFKDRGVVWAFPTIAENARVVMRGWNALRGVVSWAGLWLLIMVVMIFRFKYQLLMPIFQMSIALVGLLFVAAPIGEGRYVLFVLIGGQLALLGALTDWARDSKLRETLKSLNKPMSKDPE